MARREPPELDREQAALPADLRWREWMRRIKAVLFASAAPVARDDLAQVVGQGTSLDLLIEDMAADLEGRPYEVAHRRRLDAAHAAGLCVREPGGGGGGSSGAGSEPVRPAVLAAIAFNQPIASDGLKDIFGMDIIRELIGRLSECGLIATGPREPGRGAPYTFVTTDAFLAPFGLESLRDLPDKEQLADAGLAR